MKSWFRSVRGVVVLAVAGLLVPAALLAAADRAGARARASANELMYVADQSLEAVLVYRLPLAKQPRAVIFNGIANPGPMALDGQGNLYVTNGLTRNVTIYAPGATSPKESVGRGLFQPSGVAVAADGTLYVADSEGWFNVYESSTHRLKHTVWLPGAGQMGFDRSGNLYVLYGGPNVFGGVMRYPPHSYKGTDLGIAATSAMAVDGPGDVAAAVYENGEEAGLNLYGPPTYPQVATCTGGQFGAVFSFGLAFDPQGKYLAAAIPPSVSAHAQVALYYYSILGSHSFCSFADAINHTIENPTGVVIGPDTGSTGG